MSICLDFLFLVVLKPKGPKGTGPLGKVRSLTEAFCEDRSVHFAKASLPKVFQVCGSILSQLHYLLCRLVFWQSAVFASFVLIPAGLKRVSLVASPFRNDQFGKQCCRVPCLVVVGESQWHRISRIRVELKRSAVVFA